MRALTPPSLPGLPRLGSLLVWLGLFLSPTAYVLLIIALDRWHVIAPPEGMVVGLFCLIPVAALVGCGTMVWRWRGSLGWRAGGLVLTLLAMMIQCGFWFVVIVSAITAAIAPA